ncbi:hypothetical protein SSX86_032801 [Deinandra increscens subsp. villosa]|uniref:Exocyst subunit Exo70 family protein n=1 Tax=Deinandra increscens subsp. villosa TaxID=3103831 RepID=A0AAP0C2V0_9ASTR
MNGQIRLQKAQQLVLKWDSTVSEDARARRIFQGNRQEIDEYLQAVDEIQRSMESTTVSDDEEQSKKVNVTIQIAMARLEYEFRNILASHAIPIETESLTELISATSAPPLKNDLDILHWNMPYSDSSSFSGFYDTDDILSRGDDVSVSTISNYSFEQGESSTTSVINLIPYDSIYDLRSIGDSDISEDVSVDAISNYSLEQGESITAIASYRSMSSVREIDLIPFNSIYDLHCIAKRMITAGYFRECIQVYGSVRKSTFDASFKMLGVEKLSIRDIQSIEWKALNAKIGKWIHAARVCVKVLFASEKRLCQLIFQDLGTDADDACFMETIKAPLIQLFDFAEAISLSNRSPEKLFKILDLHDALFVLSPDIDTVFDSKSSESIRLQVTEILSRLAEAARGMLSEFEKTVLCEPSRVPVPGGTIHPLTRYVMNYICLIADYKQTLDELIVSRPATSSTYSDDLSTPDMDFTDQEGQSLLALHLIWIIIILQFNLDGKSKHYKDNSLAYVFIMNNVHYIVQKIKGSPELREIIGDNYLKRLKLKVRQTATEYQRATWVGVLYCLRDEGLHISGRVSKSVLRERFKSFNTMFGKAHRRQALWSVPDTQLREELQISISEKLIPAYRSFLGRFRTHIEHGRHPENYIKYSAEDLENALLDFFEGKAVSHLVSIHEEDESEIGIL